MNELTLTVKELDAPEVHGDDGVSSGQVAGVGRKLSADEINDLDLAAYHGPLNLVCTSEEMQVAAARLSCEKLLGFDTEKRPSFSKGESHPPALLQLAGEDEVYLFQLHRIGLPVELTRILADGGIVKAGVAVGRDLRELRALTEFEPKGFVDLGARSKRHGLQHHGLRGLAASLLGCRISKGAGLTNWARPDLPERALRYAATDAWIGRRIYKAMEERGYLGDVAVMES